MGGKRFAALVLAGCLLSAPPRAEADLSGAADWQPHSLIYEVHAGGLHVFTINLEARLKPDSYSLSLALQTDGALGWLFDWSMASAAHGRLAGVAPDPAWFRTESVWRGKTRWVALRYGEGAGAGPTVEAVPPPEEDDRPIVPEALRIDSVDPLSAGVALIYALAGRQRCDSALSVFDGRRLYKARSRDLGPRELPASDWAPFGGAARACALTVEPVTGFWRDQRYPARTQELTVYLRALSEAGPPLPVRIEAETRFGAIRAHLVDVSPRPGEG